MPTTGTWCATMPSPTTATAWRNPQTIQRLRRGLLGTDRQLLYQRLCSPLPGRQRPWCHHTDSSLVQFFPTHRRIKIALKYFYSQRRLDLGQVRILRCLLRGSDWTVPRYLAIDQCTIAPMIENYRSGLLWKLFMSCPEVQEGLQKLGFKA